MKMASEGFVKTIKMTANYADDLEIKPFPTVVELERPMSHQIAPASPPPIPKRLVKTALHQAVLDGRLHQVRLLVSKHGVSVDCKDVYGRTPLMLTSMVSEESGSKMARILIEAGSAMSVRDNMGRTALSLACMNGREKIVDEILRKDILNLNEPDNDGNTPLHHAASSGNPNICKLLGTLFSKFGIDIDVRNKLGYTGLLIACRNGHYSSAYYLLTIGGASPSLRDSETFLNAMEWTLKSSRHSALPIRRVASSSSAPTTFSRESTMYQKSLTPICNHSRTVVLPSWSRGDDIEMQRTETFINGKDARQLVINEISNAESHNWPIKPKKSQHPVHGPPTAKLLALSKRRTRSAFGPDMTAIFRMYSDQWQPDWRREKSSITLHHSTSDKIPKIIRTGSKAPITTSQSLDVC